MLVENGESCEALNVRFAGIWSVGNGPIAANDVKFNAVITTPPTPAPPSRQHQLNLEEKRRNALLSTTTSCVASTYKL